MCLKLLNINKPIYVFLFTLIEIIFPSNFKQFLHCMGIFTFIKPFFLKMSIIFWVKFLHLISELE